MLKESSFSSLPATLPEHPTERAQKNRRAKPVPFEREAVEAQRKKAEADARREAIERGKKEREEKLKERERFRKAMAKARTGGKNGQRKLGRESQVLLERVQRLVAG
jgi:uncharacterized protein with WD repeat